MLCETKTLKCEFLLVVREDPCGNSYECRITGKKWTAFKPERSKPCRDNSFANMESKHQSDDSL